MTDDELRALVAGNAQTAERLNQKTESLDRQLSLLTQQVQTMANSQAGSDTRLITAEHNIQGMYDILQAYAREQDARSQSIDSKMRKLFVCKATVDLVES